MLALRRTLASPMRHQGARDRRREGLYIQFSNSLPSHRRQFMLCPSLVVYHNLLQAATTNEKPNQQPNQRNLHLHPIPLDHALCPHYPLFPRCLLRVSPNPPGLLFDSRPSGCAEALRFFLPLTRLSWMPNSAALFSRNCAVSI